MVENQRIWCRFPFFDNAIFEPFEIKLFGVDLQNNGLILRKYWKTYILSFIFDEIEHYSNINRKIKKFIFNVFIKGFFIAYMFSSVNDSIAYEFSPGRFFISEMKRGFSAGRMVFWS